MRSRLNLSVRVLLATVWVGLSGCTTAPRVTELPSPTERCAVLVAHDGQIARVALPDAWVSGATSTGAAFELPPSTPANAEGVTCERASIVPRDNDYKVLHAGHPFSVKTPDGRLLVLELVDGRVRARFAEGSASARELAALQAFLNRIQPCFYRDPHECGVPP